MNLEYSTSIEYDSWTEPPDESAPGFTITHGRWTKRTVDRPHSPKQDETHSAYVYRPLHNPQNIRLLHLNPGWPGETLSGSLVESHICDTDTTIPHFSHSYEALSYCWTAVGDINNDSIFHPCTVMLDGILCKITRNLHGLLTVLRYEEKTRVLWTDQICINQDNNEEKGSQIPMMSLIFAAADRVLVWLGQSSSDSIFGMEALADFVRRSEDKSTRSWLDLAPDKVCKGLDDIFGRPWFTRMWTLQEAAVAKVVRVYCGYSTVTWSNNIGKVSRVIYRTKMAAISPQGLAMRLHLTNTDAFIKLLSMQLEAGPDKALYRQTRRDPTLLDIAYDMRHRNVADPRDRIYAILGFASEDVRKQIIVDYWMSFQQVHDQFEKVMFSQIQDQNIIEEEDGGNMDKACAKQWEWDAHMFRLLWPNTSQN